MRTVINGAGADVTSAVSQWLADGHSLYMATLYLIGDPEDPNALWLTDWDSPLLWSWWGSFNPAVIKRGGVTSKVGLEVQTLKVDWTPNTTNSFPQPYYTGGYQRAWLGLLDGATFRCWTAYMPVKGDCNSFGASELFGGRIGQLVIAKGAVSITVNSFLDVVNQMVPGAVIESTDIAAGYKGAVPLAGSSTIPVLTVVSGGNTQIVASGGTFTANAFVDGFVYFVTGALKGTAAVIYGNAATDSHTHNTTFDVGPLPSVPSPGDTFYVSANAGNIITGSGLYPFPYVPAPEQAV